MHAQRLIFGKLASMNVPIFQIFGLKLLSAFSRLDNKRGGIL